MLRIMLRLKVYNYNLNQGLVIYWVCFNVCDWIYFLSKFLLYSDDAYTAICLKILFSVSHFLPRVLHLDEVWPGHNSQK